MYGIERRKWGTSKLVYIKTKTMVIKPWSRTSFSTNELYKYLGSYICSKGMTDEEINYRISLAGRMYFKLNQNFLNNKEVIRKT
jgi:hypothetical protein